MKRALRNFGNLLGNCIYDKDYVSKVTKIKAAPIRWNPNNLHRHPDFTPIEKELKGVPTGQSISLPQIQQEVLTDCKEQVGLAGGFAEDEFGSDDFDAVDFAVSAEDHPDEIEVNGSKLSDDSTRKLVLPEQKMSPSRTRSGFPHEMSRFPFSTKTIEPQTPDPKLHRSRPLPPTFQQAKNVTSPAAHRYDGHHSGLPHPISEPLHEDSAEGLHDGAPVGFFTARAAESIQAGLHLP